MLQRSLGGSKGASPRPPRLAGILQSSASLSFFSSRLSPSARVFEEASDKHFFKKSLKIKVPEGFGSPREGGKTAGEPRNQTAAFQDPFLKRFWGRLGGQVGAPRFTFLLNKIFQEAFREAPGAIFGGVKTELNIEASWDRF